MTVRRLVTLAALALLLAVGLLSTLVLSPVTTMPGGQLASSLVAMAYANAKEGQGDVLSPCYTPSGKVQGGAAVAAAAAKHAGFTGQDLVIAVAVAGAESGWNPLATHLNSDGSTDYGMWQINSVHAALLAAGDWKDPYSNAQMAFKVWQGSGWGAWTTYTSGAYLSKMSAAQAAVAGAGTVTAMPASCNVPLGVPGQGEYHLTAYMIATKRSIEAQFPGLTVGCYRTLQDGGEHPKGRACDFMTYKDMIKGQQIADWVVAHSSPLHVLYVMWNHHIWGSYRAQDGWRLVPDRGSPTANHEDHVHVSVTCGPTDPAWARPCAP